jgi:pimeloyl-ACP methyl ester carboxylesterase
MPFLRTGDIDTWYERTGSGPPLVLIHGGFVDSRMWDPQVDAFAADYLVLRYDLRGHGRTGPSPRGRYSVDLFADDLVALLAGLGIRRATLCGISFGGMVAQSVAARHPEVLEGLALAGTAVSTTLTRTDRFQRCFLAPRWLFLPTIRAMGAARFVRFSSWLGRHTRNAGWFGRDEAVRRYVEEAMLRMPTAEYVKMYGAIYDFQAQDLSRVHVPTLLLNGENESRSVHRHAEHIRTLIPHAESVVIDGAGHVSNMENPEPFNRALRDLLERVHG